jgi:hypothetical protein
MVLSEGSSLAQTPCIPMTVVTPYSTGTIQAIGYNSDTKNLVATYRAAPTTVRAFQAVPQQIAQRFVGMQPNADAFFNANVAPMYHEALLTTLYSDMCPILNENGTTWLWTH